MRGFEQERKKVRIGTSGSLWIRSIEPERVPALLDRRGAAPPRQMKSNPRPPVVLALAVALAVAGSECLNDPLDTVLLPCRGSRTTDSQVRDSVTRLRQIGAEVVATVLDGVEGRRGDHGHGTDHGTEARSRDSAA